MPGKAARLMPNGSARRSVEGPLILNIPPYASHDVRDDENPTLHRPKVVESPDIFQRPSGQSHPLEVKMNFHLPLPRQPWLTDVHAWRTPALTEQGNQTIYIQIDEWMNRYEMNIFVVDEITGRMYAKIGGKLHSIPEIASHQHQD